MPTDDADTVTAIQAESAPETITYQTEYPAELWRAWRSTLPNDIAVKHAMFDLIRQAVASDHDVEYHDGMESGAVSVDPDVFAEWSDTVVRSVSLADRIEALLQEDISASRSGGYDEMDERTARLLADRIRRRSRTAQQSLDRYRDPPDDEDPDPARLDNVRENLEKIEEIADTFSE
jgi:hypothetical protein